MKVYVLFQNVEYEGDYMEDIFFTYEDAYEFLNTKIPKKYRRDYHISEWEVKGTQPVSSHEPS